MHWYKISTLYWSKYTKSRYLNLSGREKWYRNTSTCMAFDMSTGTCHQQYTVCVMSPHLLNQVTSSQCRPFLSEAQQPQGSFTLTFFMPSTLSHKIHTLVTLLKQQPLTSPCCSFFVNALAYFKCLKNLAHTLLQQSDKDVIKDIRVKPVAQPLAQNLPAPSEVRFSTDAAHLSQWTKSSLNDNENS